MPLKGGKLGDESESERDEDLLLFKELLKREKDRVSTLLLPVSEEFEPNQNGSLLSAGNTPLIPTLILICP